MERPTSPGLRPWRAMTANRAAKSTMQLPTDSSRTASHLRGPERAGSKPGREHRVQALKGFPVLPASGLPVGHDAWVVGLLVFVHFQVTLPNEPLLLAEGADDADTQERLVEVRVDWRAADRL